MAEVRSRGDPIVLVEMARLPATTAAGGPASVSIRGPDSLLGRLREAVADAEHRLDVLLPDLLPDVLDMRVDRALVRLERDASHRVQQLRPREHPARLPRHQRHNLKFALRQIDAAAAESRFHPRHVELDA